MPRRSHYKPSVGPKKAAEFRRKVQWRLNRHTRKLTALLKRLIKHPYPPDFWQLDFEVETQDFTRDFPISVCFYMENFRSVGPGDKT